MNGWMDSAMKPLRRKHAYCRGGRCRAFYVFHAALPRAFSNHAQNPPRLSEFRRECTLPRLSSAVSVGDMRVNFHENSASVCVQRSPLEASSSNREILSRRSDGARVPTNTPSVATRGIESTIIRFCVKNRAENVPCDFFLRAPVFGEINLEYFAGRLRLDLIVPRIFVLVDGCDKSVRITLIV